MQLQSPSVFIIQLQNKILRLKTWWQRTCKQ